MGQRIPIRFVSAGISAVGLVLNASGLAILSKVSLSQSNNIWLIKHLSGTNILVAIGWLLRDLEVALKFKFQKKVKKFIDAFHTGTFSTWLLMICAMTFDRFLAVRFPLLYRTNSSKYRIVVWSIWCLGLTSSVANATNDEKMWKPIYDRYVFILLDVIFLVLFAITYSTVYSRIQSRGANGGTRMCRSYMRSIKAVGAILCTFILFEIVPNICLMITYILLQLKNPLIFDTLLLCTRFNLIADPLIYILLHPRIHGILMRLIPRKWRVFPSDDH